MQSNDHCGNPLFRALASRVNLEKPQPTSTAPSILAFVAQERLPFIHSTLCILTIQHVRDVTCRVTTRRLSKYHCQSRKRISPRILAANSMCFATTVRVPSHTPQWLHRSFAI